MTDIQLLRVPKWGLSMEEGTIAAWLIAEGESFSEGQEICEIETSKIANVMEAPFAGQLRRIIAQVGETLPVQATIAVAAPSSVDDAAIDAFLAEAGELAGAAPESELASEPALEKTAPYEPPISAVPSPDSPAGHGSESSPTPSQTGRAGAAAIAIPELLKGDSPPQVLASPRALAFAKAQGIDLSKVSGTGRLDRVEVNDIRLAIESAGGTMPVRPLIPAARAVSPAYPADETINATPVARRLAAQRGIPLGACRPTGRHGRVCKADVEAMTSMQSGLPAVEPVASPSPGLELESQGNSYTEIPMTGMRRTIAARLSESKREAPHFRVSVDVEMDALAALRRQINEQHPGVKVSVNDFVIKAVAMALVVHRECNIQFDGTIVRQFEHADVAVAVAMEAGLITPILRQADSKSLLAISTEMRGLATRAKASTLRPDEFQGGTFTISNLGMFGVSQFDAIINPPQAAILAVGGTREELRMRNGAPTAVSLMALNLASDHRVIDGALAAQFLQTLKRNLETPAVMLAG